MTEASGGGRLVLFEFALATCVCAKNVLNDRHQKVKTIDSRDVAPSSPFSLRLDLPTIYLYY